MRSICAARRVSALDDPLCSKPLSRPRTNSSRTESARAASSGNLSSRVVWVANVEFGSPDQPTSLALPSPLLRDRLYTGLWIERESPLDLLPGVEQGLEALHRLQQCGSPNAVSKTGSRTAGRSSADTSRAFRSSPKIGVPHATRRASQCQVLGLVVALQRPRRVAAKSGREVPGTPPGDASWIVVLTSDHAPCTMHAWRLKPSP